MSALFELGREGFLDGTLDWDTNTFKVALLDLNTADTGVKAVTGATNVAPIVLTITSHGFANGDTILVDGVAGNLAANGIWLVANQTTHTVELTRPDGVNSTGSGAYTSGGYAACLGPSGAGDNYDDFDGCVVGADQTITTPTKTAGVADADDLTYTSVTGASVEALGIYKDTGSPSTSRMVALITGRHIVTASADAAISATTLWVEPLAAGIASGQVLTFSNGKSATLSGSAAAGARSLAVTSLSDAITAGSRAIATANGGGLPVTPNGGNISVTWSNTATKIFKL